MAFVIVRLLFILSTATWSFAFYVIDKTDGDKIYYFSETGIKVNPDNYVEACRELPWDAEMATVANQAEQFFLFESYSGSHGYLIGHVGPLRDGTFLPRKRTNYSNFANESEARGGDFGMVYIDFPNNWWKVAPLLGPKKMNYICVSYNPCSTYPPRCGSGAAVCVFNTSSGLVHCQSNATRCDDGVTCLHGGTCIDHTNGGYVCQCRQYFTGKHCEHYSKCQINNTCQNGGSCYNKQWSSSASCHCTDGYYGESCQHDVSTCSSDYESCGIFECTESRDWHYCLCPLPELDSHLCVSSELASRCWDNIYSTLTAELANQRRQFVRPYVNINGSMACGCDDDDVMDNNNTNNCEIDINECASSPCQNGGKCVDKMGGYECDCGLTYPPGYFGNHCQYRRGYCRPNLCRHGASCKTIF